VDANAEARRALNSGGRKRSSCAPVACFDHLSEMRRTTIACTTAADIRAISGPRNMVRSQAGEFAEPPFPRHTPAARTRPTSLSSLSDLFFVSLVFFFLTLSLSSLFFSFVFSGFFFGGGLVFFFILVPFLFWGVFFVLIGRFFRGPCGQRNRRVRGTHQL